MQTETQEIPARFPDQKLVQELLENLKNMIYGKTTREEEQKVLLSLKTLESFAVCHLMNLTVTEIFLDSKPNTEEVETFYNNIHAVLEKLRSNGVLGEADLYEFINDDILDGIQLIEKQKFITKRSIINTKLFYEQQKFNLLYENCEGFSILIQFLIDNCHLSVKIDENEAGIHHSSYLASFFNEIEGLIGRFDLDPNKVLEILIEFAAFSSQMSVFSYLFSNFNKKRILEIVKKNAFFVTEPGPRIRTYFGMLVFLVKQNLISPFEIWDNISPFDDEISTEFEKRRLVAFEITKSIFEAEFYPTEEEEKEAESKIARFKNIMENSSKMPKIYFLEMLLRENLVELFIKVGRNVIFSLDIRTCKNINKELNRVLAEYLVHIEDFSCGLNQTQVDFLRHGNLDSFAQSNSGQNPEASSVFIHGEIAAEPFYLQKQIGSPKEPEKIVFLKNTWRFFELFGKTILLEESLFTKLITLLTSFLNANPTLGGLVVEILETGIFLQVIQRSMGQDSIIALWDLLQKMDIRLRNRLYKHAIEASACSNTLITARAGEVVEETRKFLRNYSVTGNETSKNAEAFRTIYRNNLFVCFVKVVKEVQKYDNLIVDLIPALKFATDFELDVLTFLLINEIEKASGKILTDELEIEKKYINLSDFTANLLQAIPKLNAQIFLKVITKTLFQENSVKNNNNDVQILMVYFLKSILEKGHGYKNVLDLTRLQKKAFSGGPALKAASLFLFDFSEVCFRRGFELDRTIEETPVNIFVDFTIEKNTDLPRRVEEFFQSVKKTKLTTTIFWDLLVSLVSLRNNIQFRWNIESMKPVSTFCDLINEDLFLLIEFCRPKCRFSENGFENFCAMISAHLQSQKFLLFTDIVFLIQKFIQLTEIGEMKTHTSLIVDYILYFWNRQKSSIFPIINRHELTESEVKNYLTLFELRPYMINDQTKIYQRQIEVLKENILDLENSENFKNKVQTNKSLQIQQIFSESEEGEIKEAGEETKPEPIVILPNSVLIKKLEKAIFELEKELNVHLVRISENSTGINEILSKPCKVEITNGMLTNVILPRLLFSIDEAMLFSKVIKKNILSKTEDFQSYQSALFSLCRLILPAINALSERENDNLCAFLTDLIKFNNEKDLSDKLRQRMLKLFDLKIKMNSSENASEDKTRGYIISFIDNYRENLLTHENHVEEFQSLCLAIFGAKSFNSKKNVLKLMNDCLPIFPKSKKNCELILNSINSQKEFLEEYNDLKLLSVSYKTNLKVRVKKLDQELEERNRGPENTLRNEQSNIPENYLKKRSNQTQTQNQENVKKPVEFEENGNFKRIKQDQETGRRRKFNRNNDFQNQMRDEPQKKGSGEFEIGNNLPKFDNREKNMVIEESQGRNQKQEEVDGPKNHEKVEDKSRYPLYQREKVVNYPKYDERNVRPRYRRPDNMTDLEKESWPKRQENNRQNEIFNKNKDDRPSLQQNQGQRKNPN